MINRGEVEDEYRTLWERWGYGLVGYSPLLGGYLTGKYLGEEGKEGGRFKDATTSGWSK